jgi:hypothetical protein
MPKKEGTDPKREDLHLTFFFTKQPSIGMTA